MIFRDWRRRPSTGLESHLFRHSATTPNRFDDLLVTVLWSEGQLSEI
jgi:hypothetical protein